MKPIHLWIAALPEQQRKDAESNMYKFPISDRDELAPSLQSALLQAFVWGLGYGSIDYWSDVYHGKINRLF